MADQSDTENGTFAAGRRVAASAVEGELTPTVRAVRLVIAAWVVRAVAAGFGEGFSSPQHSKAALPRERALSAGEFRPVSGVET